MSKINEIKAIYESNALVIRQCAALLNNMPDIITEGAIAEITGGNEGLEEYAFSFFLSSLFFEDDGEASKFHKEYYLKSVKKLNPNEYLENPYYKTLKFLKNQREAGHSVYRHISHTRRLYIMTF